MGESLAAAIAILFRRRQGGEIAKTLLLSPGYSYYGYDGPGGDALRSGAIEFTELLRSF
ncbi:hypothetical protein [Occallatibacter riparius]|uniref:Uncharacterized protein n=1 Tax=Occallatibacter riparius TaxID=1002689 RepID=A0A9J7BZ01_9BACT|nr:hypothetical protein [Occallatibacter riparius]UWZ86734.1 hypothetical protein MOP44_12480 [Occallatibacter riparius]